MLHRYWLVIDSRDRYGVRNLGVTALTSEHAKILVKDELKNLKWMSLTGELIDNAEAIEDIDVNLLDQGHIKPNMGVVSNMGIWWPALNI
jgi:hypothetical protein